MQEKGNSFDLIKIRLKWYHNREKKEEDKSDRIGRERRVKDKMERNIKE